MMISRDMPAVPQQASSELSEKGLNVGAIACFLGDGVIGPCQGKIEKFYAPKKGRADARVLMTVSGNLPSGWPYATREFAPRVVDLEPVSKT